MYEQVVIVARAGMRSNFDITFNFLELFFIKIEEYDIWIELVQRLNRVSRHSKSKSQSIFIDDFSCVTD